MTERSTTNPASSAEQIVAMSRELTQLRRAHESLQNRFRALEAYVARRSDQPFDLVFAGGPAETAGIQIDDLQGAAISQVFPVASTGVLGFAVHLQDIGGDHARIRFTLTTAEDARVLGVWTKTSKDLSIGWNAFGLPRAITGIRRTLLLRVSVEAGPSRLRLSVGPIQPLPRYQVTDCTTLKPVAPRSLALKVWAGLPGVRIPEAPDLNRADAVPAPSGPREWVVPPEALARVIWGNSDDAEFKTSPVSLLLEQGVISCHPPRYGSTVAVLPAALPPGAVCVSATVNIANHQSSAVSFALAIAHPHFASGGASLPGEDDEREVIYSEWVTIEPDQPGTINLFIENDLHEGWRDIRLLTRMALEGKNDYAWARFSAVTALIDDL